MSKTTMQERIVKSLAVWVRREIKFVTKKEQWSAVAVEPLLALETSRLAESSTHWVGEREELHPLTDARMGLKLQQLSRVENLHKQTRQTRG